MCLASISNVYIKFIESVQHKFFRIIAPQLGLADSFVKYVNSEIALKLQIPSLKTLREFNDIKYLLKLTTELFDCPSLISIT